MSTSMKHEISWHQVFSDKKLNKKYCFIIFLIQNFNLRDKSIYKTKKIVNEKGTRPKMQL